MPSKTAKGAPTGSDFVILLSTELKLDPGKGTTRSGGDAGGIYSLGGDNFRPGLKLSAPAISCGVSLIGCKDNEILPALMCLGVDVAVDVAVLRRRYARILPTVNICCQDGNRRRTV
jgi:hypothetical protein